MKKLAIGFSFFAGFYLLGFFGATPLMLMASKTNLPIANKVGKGIHYKLYWSWVKELDKSNIIRTTWVSNTIYWCDAFSNCKLEHENEKGFNKN